MSTYHFQQITPESPGLDFFHRVYEASFIADERRSRAQVEAEMRAPQARVGLITDGSSRVGIFIYWELSDFVYIGHFAVHPDYRNRKIGEAFLGDFLGSLKRPAVFEVEPPSEAIACRRIAFYERLGCVLHQRGYLQPAYELSKEAVPLLLMTTDISFLDQHFDRIEQEMHREVYAKQGL